MRHRFLKSRTSCLFINWSAPTTHHATGVDKTDLAKSAGHSKQQDIMDNVFVPVGKQVEGVRLPFNEYSDSQPNQRPQVHV